MDRIRWFFEEMGINGAIWIAIIAILIGAGGREVVNEIRPDPADYPPMLVDHGGRGPDDARGAETGAATSSPRPELAGVEYAFYGSPNWSPRGFNTVEAIVVHVTGPGTCPGMRSWFKNATAGASAHFGVCKDGSLEQYVETGDGAWHAGIVNVPDLTNPLIASWIAAGVNPNSRTIGIELLLAPGEALADYPEMRATFHSLMQWLGPTFDVELDRQHVIGHYQIDAVNRSVDPRCCVDIDLELGLIDAGPTSCPSGFFNPEGYQWDGCLEPYGRWEHRDGQGYDPSAQDWYLYGVKEWARCEWWGGRRNYRNGDFLYGGTAIFIDEGGYWSTAPAC